jgi:hypothetical protein
MSLDIFNTIKDRAVPVFKDGAFQFNNTSSGYAIVDKEGVVKYSDPDSQVVESDDTHMRHRFVISTVAEDRTGDIVVPKGCLARIDRYKNNPVVFLNHMSGSLPIAKSENPETKQFALQIMEDRIIADAFFHCKTQASIDTYELVKLGYLKGASIGFNPIKGELIRRKDESNGDVIDFKNVFCGLKFEEWELMEWSVVGIPCNHEALEGMKSWLSKKDGSEFYRTLREGLPKERSVTVSVQGDVPTEEKDVPANSPSDENPVLELPPVDAEQNPEQTESKKETVDVEKLAIEQEKAITELQTTLMKRLQEVQNEFISKLSDLVPPADFGTEVSEEQLPEESPKKIPPIGAAVLLKLLRELDEAYHLIENKLSQVDNPKTVNFLGEVHGDVDTLMHKIHKFGGKNYPDFFPKNDKFEKADVLKKLEPEVKEVPVETKKEEVVQETKTPEFDWSAILPAIQELNQVKEVLANKLYELTGK